LIPRLVSEDILYNPALLLEGHLSLASPPLLRNAGREKNERDPAICGGDSFSEALPEQLIPICANNDDNYKKRHIHGYVLMEQLNIRIYMPRCLCTFNWATC
jgi:hypothetical protein